MATISEIQTCINNLSTTSADELLLLSAETNSLTTDRVVKVADVNSLPDLKTCTLSNGTTVFVDSINVPVMVANGSWVGLDNRVLRQDYIVGQAFSWGGGTTGQLGNGLATNTSVPGCVVGGIIDWNQICAGSESSHSLGLTFNGTIWAWGSNNSGRLGDGTTTNKSSPVPIVGGFTDWCQISTGSSFSLAIRSNGTAWGWGVNNIGQIGDGTSINKCSPVSMVGGFTDWCQVSAGFEHSLGLRTNGTIWAWGCNGSGSLGTNSDINTSSPVSVVGGFTDWCQVSAGKRHSLGLRMNGSAWAWGDNGNGRLGDGTVANKSSPVSIIGGFTDWCQVSASALHSLGLRTNGTIWAWGSNNAGRLGDGTTVDKSSPVSVVGGFTDWCQISNGASFSLAIRTNGTAWSWGGNAGNLGDATIVSKSSPVSVFGGFTDWYQITGGNFHTLALRKS